jgi:hypothetical protein
VTSNNAPDANHGYLGLVERKYIEVDWDAVAEHGPCVIVRPYSPAWRAGVRSGDFIISINDVSYYDFYAVLPPPGTAFKIVFWRKGHGRLTAFETLGTTPKFPERKDICPENEPGKPVAKRERPEFIQGFISKHLILKAIDTRLLSLLLNYEGPKGIIPKRRTLAQDLSCSLSTLDRSIRRCRGAGFLRVESGKSERHSNSYTVTWPANHKRSKQSQE